MKPTMLIAALLACLFISGCLESRYSDTSLQKFDPDRNSSEKPTEHNNMLIFHKNFYEGQLNGPVICQALYALRTPENTPKICY